MCKVKFGQCSCFVGWKVANHSRVPKRQNLSKEATQIKNNKFSGFILMNFSKKKFNLFLDMKNTVSPLQCHKQVLMMPTKDSRNLL